MKPRPEIIGEKVELLALYSKVSPEEMESARVQALKHFESAAGQAAEDEPSVSQPSRTVRKWQWPAVAALAAAVALAVLLPIRIVQSAPAVLEDANGSRKIQYGELVRPTGDMSAMLSMADGPRVETRSMSEFLLERTDDGGTRIHLNMGGLIVDAASQRSGNLVVQTKEITALVSGAVSLVKAGEEGSSVAAIGWEVRVQQGTAEKKLAPGEQVTSNPKMESIPVREQVAWSREAVAHIASLQQAAVAPKERIAFEVTSIRPSGPAVTRPGTRGGGQGLNSRPSPNGCVFGSFGYSSQLDPRRFAATRVTVMHLASYTIPYPMPPGASDQPGSCGSLTGMGLLSGGPDWVKTDAWDLEAAIPEGTFTQKPTLTNPVMLQMIRTMLEERFKLVLRKETKEIPVYLLRVGKGGPKFNGQIPLTSDRWGGVQIVRLDPDGKPVPAADLPPLPDGGIVTFGGRCTAPTETCGQLSARNVSMANLATYLYGIDGRPVLDRTGLAGRYDFHYVDPGVQEAFARIISMRIQEGYGGFGPPGDSLSRAALKASGLELEEGMAPFDAWVIERVEKPSEN